MSAVRRRRPTPRRRDAPRWVPEDWLEATQALMRRSGGRCERCKQRFDLTVSAHRHHRIKRRVGGDRLSNLLLVCQTCHDWIHKHPAASRERGWIVSSYGQDPSEAPVLIGGARWLLDDSGTCRRIGLDQNRPE